MYIFSKDLHISYTEICGMPFFEILYILEKYKKDLEEENKRTESMNKDQTKQMEGFKSSMPKIGDMKLPQMPNYSSFNMPSMPKL